jgi:hypothetical protein
MRKLLIILIVIFSVSVFAQEFQPTGKKLSLSLVFDDDIMAFVFGPDLYNIQISPQGFEEPIEGRALNYYSFNRNGFLQYKDFFGRERQYLYSKVQVEDVKMDGFMINMRRGNWYKAVDGDSNVIYFNFYYDATNGVYMHTLRLLNSDLRIALYRVVESKDL